QNIELTIDDCLAHANTATLGNKKKQNRNGEYRSGRFYRIESYSRRSHRATSKPEEECRPSPDSASEVSGAPSLSRERPGMRPGFEPRSSCPAVSRGGKESITNRRSIRLGSTPIVRIRPQSKYETRISVRDQLNYDRIWGDGERVD
ncbi:unnamed protein product, partial [Trichogramma brassicae]